MEFLPDNAKLASARLVGNDDDGDSENDSEAIREQVAALDLSGASFSAPDGRVVEVFRKSCAEVLQENGVVA